MPAPMYLMEMATRHSHGTPAVVARSTSASAAQRIRSRRAHTSGNSTRAHTCVPPVHRREVEERSAVLQRSTWSTDRSPSGALRHRSAHAPSATFVMAGPRRTSFAVPSRERGLHTTEAPGGLGRRSPGSSRRRRPVPLGPERSAPPALSRTTREDPTAGWTGSPTTSTWIARWCVVQHSKRPRMRPSPAGRRMHYHPAAEASRRRTFHVERQGKARAASLALAASLELQTYAEACRCRPIWLQRVRYARPAWSPAQRAHRRSTAASSSRPVSRPMPSSMCPQPRHLLRVRTHPSSSDPTAARSRVQAGAPPMRSTQTTGDERARHVASPDSPDSRLPISASTLRARSPRP